MKNLILTFDRSAASFVLGAFGTAVDENNYLVEASDRTRKVLTPKGEEIRRAEFAGVRKGSAIYIKSDIDSLIEAADLIP